MSKLYIGLRKTGSILSTLLTIFLALVLVVVLINNYNVANNNQESFFTYQPVYIQTGSMEPTLRESSIVVTKRVNSIDEIAVDDIVSYVVFDKDSNKEVFITHRVYNINEDGTIMTKGDNNRVTDAYTLTMDNVKAKVIYTWNGFATIKNMLETKEGKMYIGAMFVILVLLMIAWSNFIDYLDEKTGYKKPVQATQIIDCENEQSFLEDTNSSENNEENNENI